MYKISGKMNKNRENIHEYAKTVEEKREKLICNMKCEKINELSFHTSFFMTKNQ